MILSFLPKTFKWQLQRKEQNFYLNQTLKKFLGIREEASGVTLENGEKITSKVVVNVAGPHSMKVNQMADVENDMNIKTKALKVEVCHVPSPSGFNYEREGFVISDSDIGCYSRPEIGNNVLIGVVKTLSVMKDCS